MSSSVEDGGLCKVVKDATKEVVTKLASNLPADCKGDEDCLLKKQLLRLVNISDAVKCSPNVKEENSTSAYANLKMLGYKANSGDK